MPDLIAHHLFGHEVLNLMPASVRSDAVHNVADFDLGCNGPDPFFYYHTLPWQSGKHTSEVYSYGSLMHNRNISYLMERALEYVKKYPVSRSYLYGFFCHYFLDRNTHPFVYYRAGFHDDHNKKHYHKRYEVGLDQYLLPIKQNTDFKHFHPTHILRIGYMNLPVSTAVIRNLLKEVYNVRMPEDFWRQSIEDFRNTILLLYAKTPMKRKIVQGVETVLGLSPLASSAMYPCPPEDYDFLNEAHAPWKKPCKPETTRTESFLELYENGINEARRFFETLEQWLNGNATIRQLLDMIGNRSFDTDEVDLPMLKCESIFDHN